MALDPAIVHGLPPGWASDIEVLALTGSIVESHRDHLVVRTPENPGYHWGNLVVVRAPVRRDDAPSWVACFRSAFPAAQHRSVGLPAEPDPAPWAAAGLRVEADEVLISDRPPHARAPASGYTFRRLATAADGAAAAEHEVRDESGQRPAPDLEADAAYRRFAERRWRSRATASEAGVAAFFGAFHDGRLVACLGIVRCSDHARYQSVLTDRGHRGRGLAGHLLQIAGAWAAGQGAERWMIIVEPESVAARIYRTVGFTFETLTWQASAV